MKKVRVFELAKTFGMKGPELAKLLRDMGFENIKTHMTVLDEADEMMVLARLEAHGLKRQTEDEAKAAPGRGKKKLPSAGGLEPEAEPQGDALPRKLTRAERDLKELPKKQLPKSTARRARKLETEEAASEPAALSPEPAAPTAAPAAKSAPEPRVTAPQGSGSEATEPEADAPAVEVAPAAEQAAPAAAAPTPEPEFTAPAATAASDAPAAAEPVQRPSDATPVESARAEAESAPAAAAAAGMPPASAGGEAAELEPATGEPVRKLLVPQKKATVVGRIELPQETIRDARSRSAPAADRDLRRAALQKTQQRSATRSPMGGHRRGPGGPMQRGGRDQGRGGARKGRPVTTVDPSKEVEITPPVSIKSFSEALGIKVPDLLATLLFKLKIPGKNINSYLTQDEVELVALELERNVKIVEQKHAEEEMIEKLVEDAAGQEENTRAPVVTFMGHVDHGKTSLMDALRNTDIRKGEAGGITQHIGAYKVTHEKGEFVILDTPGHAAFTAMRARGADLTDLVVIVVAGDDGVMPQTEEAINHAKAAEVPVIVAITKSDLPASNAMQVKQQLMVKGLQPEEWGGSTGVVEVSAVTRKGLGDLVERIMLDAELLELKARPDAPGRGIVVESKQSPEQGVVVNVLITDGTLRVKDQIVCGESFSRVRAMIDDHGRQVSEAGPSTPVTVFGLDRLPTPGDKLFAVEDAKKAREVVEDRQRRIREQSLADRSAVTLETLSAKLAEKNVEEIKVILKADAMGSLEPLRKCLDELATSEVRVNLVHSGLGGINETDVSLAEASGAVILGFHTIADSSARQAAERAGVEIRYYDVIYELLDQVRAAMEGMLKPEEVESVLGHAEIRAVFKSSKFGTIAGCYITDGVCKRNAKVRLSRDGKVVYTGKVSSLRREKDDAKEVRAGFECGMTLQDYQDIKAGDILEFAQVDLVRRTL
ncbi:MAG: translation initiation factor IF-2 [Planctomycetota bacterium]